MRNWYKQAKDFWGKAGSGVLYVCMEDETALLLLRSAEVEDAHTWGVPGGAVSGTEGMYDDEDLEEETFEEEHVRQSAEKEVLEEMGYLPSSAKEIGTTVFRSGNFSYTTYILAVSIEEKKLINQKIRLNWESQTFGWFPFDKLPPNIHQGVVFTMNEWKRQQNKVEANSWNTLKKTARYGGSENERGIWYHGTSKSNLSSILSQGLIPDPKEKVWPEEDMARARFESPSLASLGGVYLSKNFGTAYSSAGARGRDKENHKVFVIVDVQPRSLVSDEDSVVSALAHAAPTRYVGLEMFFARELETNREFIEESKQDYIAAGLKRLQEQLKSPMNSKLKSRLLNLLKEGWDIALDRQVAHAGVEDGFGYKQTFYRNISPDMKKRLDDKFAQLQEMSLSETEKEDAYSDFVNSLIPPKPDIVASEKRYAQFADKVTKTMKNLARPEQLAKDWNITARSLEPIGFSGSNKIIAIVEEIRDREEEANGNYTNTKLKVWYGTPPSKFLSDYKQFAGSFKEIV